MLNEIEKEVSASTQNLSIIQAKSHDSRLDTELNPSEPMSEKPQILEEVVIEEVSIDGMCGVY